MKKIILSFFVIMNFAFAGNYGVGVKIFKFIDDTREELLTKDKSDKREVIFKVWYPTKSDTNNKTVHLLYGEPELPIVPLLTKELGITKDKLENFQTETVFNAEIANSNTKFPLIIYNHGAGTLMEENQTLIESLVKKGIIVLSVAHKFDTLSVLDGKGNIVPLDVKAKIEKRDLKKGYKEKELSALLESIRNTEIDIKHKETFYEIYDAYIENTAQVNYYVNDSLSALKKLTELNEAEFKDSIDTNRYIALGFSIGGAVSSVLLNTYEECVGAINLDGTHFGIRKEHSFTKPYLGLISGLDVSREDNRIIKDLANDKYNYIEFKNSSHFNFTDIAIILPEYKAEATKKDPVPFLGMIDENYMGAKVKELVGNFVTSIYDNYDFNVYLNTLKDDKNLRVNPYN